MPARRTSWRHCCGRTSRSFPRPLPALALRPAELRGVVGGGRSGKLSAAAAARAIEAAPLEEIADAAIDHQRALRTGFPEVIFGQGKTPAQVVALAGRLIARHGVVLATRLDDA